MVRISELSEGDRFYLNGIKWELVSGYKDNLYVFCKREGSVLGRYMSKHTKVKPVIKVNVRES